MQQFIHLPRDGDEQELYLNTAQIHRAIVGQRDGKPEVRVHFDSGHNAISLRGAQAEAFIRQAK